MTVTGILRNLGPLEVGIFEGGLVGRALSSFLKLYFVLFYVSRFQVIFFQTRVHCLNFFSKFLFVVMLERFMLGIWDVKIRTTRLTELPGNF